MTDEPGGLALFESEAPFVKGVVRELTGRPSLPPLSPKGPWKPALVDTVGDVSAEDVYGAQLADASFGAAVRAGLHLWNDALDESHTISQGIEHETGSYWHAIMHRREGDYGNSKHWFRKTGDHPVFTPLAELAQGAVQRVSTGGVPSGMKKFDGRTWDPGLFVALCEEAVGSGGALVTILETLQLYEIQLLLAYSEARALGR